MADVTMKTLINSLVTVLETAITTNTISANKVFKGLQDAPQMSTTLQYPYVMIDDAGEKTEESGSATAMVRVFRIVIEMACYSIKNVTEALDQVLDLTQEVKVELEKEANRKADGFKWGVEIVPFGWVEERYFFRGRRVIIEYIQLEDRIDVY